MTADPSSILKSVFGYDTFKPYQLEVIQNVLQKCDTQAILPTGGGKSLCYQIPALIFRGLTVVISPLIALMKDQVEQLHEAGVPALFLNSTLSPAEYAANMEAVRNGKIKLLYVAPETLLTPRIFNLLHSLPLDCLTIDEAHCISEWGHDFRPEYRQLAEVRTHFPEAVCLALTATATPRVRKDIQTCLAFDAANEFVASFDRSNLLIEVRPKINPLQQTLKFLEGFPNQSGIIYCFTRLQVDSLASTLSSQGISARPYHAGLEDSERKNNQELFIHDDIQVIVATIAFGMGINKSNVRFILHHDLPQSIEGYYQEIGRAGRDGLPAHCLLLYSYGDAQKLRFFIDQKEEQMRKAANGRLEALIHYAESAGCRRTPLLAYFGERFTKDNCGMCDNCQAGEKKQVDITIPAQKFISCVKRTGEKFSARHVIEVLLGKKTEKIAQHGHQNLSTYGIGKELTQKQWQHLARQLVQKSLLSEGGKYGRHKLTPKAYSILKNKEPIMGILLEDEPQALTRKGLPADYDLELFEILRKKRKELADAAQVPPYVVFSDKTLAEMACYYPMTERNLRNTNGVGEVKFARYGEIFLDLIRGYCQTRNLAEKIRPAGDQTVRSRQTELGERSIQVGEAFNAGRSLVQLAAENQVRLETIIQHLINYALAGNALCQNGEFLAISRLTADEQATVLETFKRLGAERLKPVFEELGGTISYDELKILRLHYLSSTNRQTS
jgi:ATP-dependent DNA helicase RecQ